MIDTHSHLLPGLDHGCPDIEASARMARTAAAAGVDTIVCTPHLKDLDLRFVNRAREVIEELRFSFAAAGIEVALILGFEVELNVAALASRDELRLLAIEGGGGAILIETPYWGWPSYAHETIFRLTGAGFLPILAHPERNDRIQRDPTLLTTCLGAGAVAQATTPSVDGFFGRASKQSFYRHLLRGEIGLLASDAHASRPSSWTIEPMLAALQGRVSQEDLKKLTDVNPRAVLSGRRPAVVAPARPGSAWRGKLRRPGVS